MFFLTFKDLYCFVSEFAKCPGKRREAADKVIDFIGRFCPVYFAVGSEDLWSVL